MKIKIRPFKNMFQAYTAFGTVFQSHNRTEVVKWIKAHGDFTTQSIKWGGCSNGVVAKKFGKIQFA